jgi:hypothetical protein
MRRYEPNITGPPTMLPIPLLLPPAKTPVAVTIRRGSLTASPGIIGVSIGDMPLPPSGAWRCFAETDPQDRRQIQAIAARFGPLTTGGWAAGERLALWTALINDLRPLTEAWTTSGLPSGPVERGAAWAKAEELQLRLVEEHQNSGGRFASFASFGIGPVLRDMDTWWRWEALNAVWEGHPMRRCKWCDLWFSLKGQRFDQGFHAPRCRSAFHQNRKPPTAPWAEVI